MSESKQVKVDNWGVFFLQRLKHFFNRTDYCDLTLQFQDNAQLKVHRLVVNACTEYFEVLERTCEMYEDCLVMPDDLQADVVVPIVNFMYTGQLEFKMDILERMHATSEIMNMPVLTKLLDSHRPKNKIKQNYAKRPIKTSAQAKSTIIDVAAPTSVATSISIATPTPVAGKRTYVKAFDQNKQSTVLYKDKKQFQPTNRQTMTMNVTSSGLVYHPISPTSLDSVVKVKRQKFVGDPRPTRYELPEELDNDNIFANSFCNISYTSQPLMVHPETTKKYAKRPKQDKGQASTLKKLRSTTLDIVECKKIDRETEDCYYEETESAMASDETQLYKTTYQNSVNIKTEPVKDANKLFDQLLDRNDEHSAKVTIETTKNNKAAANLDHAKIISEVLKKYPHLVKSNKNIKLKIFNNPAPSTKGINKKQKTSPQPLVDKPQHFETDTNSDFTYETDVLDSKQAARLIAMGAENISGPWICLICGTPGKALHFTSYFKFRRHLVEVHHEKPVLNICEYCGQRMSKRNHLLHHMYTKHGVEPPPSHNFPKCSQCSYIALTEALLVKHKLTHVENKNFRCNVCPSSFNTSALLLAHIQNTGHKYIADRKHSHQCIYCLRVFIRENNLYAHLKTHHKMDAIRDGIIDDSDDESKVDLLKVVKLEPASNYFEDNHMEYHIQQKPDGNIQLIQKKQTEVTTPSKQKNLNAGLVYSEISKTPKSLVSKTTHNIQTEHQDELTKYNEDNEENEEIVIIDNNEYIMSGNRLMLRKPTKQLTEEYILSDLVEHDKSEESSQSTAPSTSMDYATILSSNDNIQQASIILKDTEHLSEPIPIYEEDYKALMSSDHNVIFDSNDANKTLTVLTTPDAATLDNTSINLANPQNNEMMIIHEEYPLNVSEAVATENSNIVVVYSQQVSGQNKEYQLLTTQALGPQYAHTSAILTQKYETVSTTSPVMSAHILDSSVATWQDGIHQTIDNQHIDNNAVIQSIVHAEEVQTADEPKAIEDISDLPEVQLMPESNNFNQNGNIDENINNDPINSELIQNTTQNISERIDASLDAQTEDITLVESVPINEEVIQEVVDETKLLKESDPKPIKQVPDLEILSEVEEQPEAMDVNGPETNENVMCLDVHNSDTNENIISMDIQSSDTNEIETNVNDPITKTVHVTKVEPDSTENELCAPEIVDKSEMMTSGWSEENVETPAQVIIDETEIEVQTDCERNPEEVEESIETIQQELTKQMIETKPGDDDDADVGSLTKNSSSEPNEDESKTAVNPQEKISSLLNDWDEMEDFPENNEMDESVPTEPTHNQNLETNNVISENEQELLKDMDTSKPAEDSITPSIVPNGDEDTDNAHNPNNPETNESLPENKIVVKQDNIKSLVSDWDDEEDNKE